MYIKKSVETFFVYKYTKVYNFLCKSFVFLCKKCIQKYTKVYNFLYALVYKSIQ